MALTDEAKGLMTKGPDCTVGIFVGANPDGIGDELVEALADRTIPATKIVEALAARGHKIGSTTMQRHRRGECNCDPS